MNAYLIKHFLADLMTIITKKKIIKIKVALIT